MISQPMQPIVQASDGRIRFQENAIVRFLLDRASQGVKTDLNNLACMDFSDADRQQLAQLIGYSVSGYHELPYVTDAAAAKASEAARLALGLPADEPVGCRDKGCPIHCDSHEDSNEDEET